MDKWKIKQLHDNKLKERDFTDRHKDTQTNKNLSTATAHLLSIKSVIASNVAGKANAAKRVFKTVIIAPRFINSIASPVISDDVSILTDHGGNVAGQCMLKSKVQLYYLMSANPELQCLQQ